MSDVIDGFGEVYMAYYKGKPSNHVTERDDGFIREVQDAHYARAAAKLEFPVDFDDISGSYIFATPSNGAAP
jgi:hypothetical protein